MSLNNYHANAPYGNNGIEQQHKYRSYNDKELLRLAKYGSRAAVENIIPNVDDLDVRDTKDNNQYTALHWAVSRRMIGNVDALLHAGANPNAQDKYGCAPIYLLLTRLPISSELPVIRAIFTLLINNGADPLTTDDVDEFVDNLTDFLRNQCYVQAYIEMLYEFSA